MYALYHKTYKKYLGIIVRWYEDDQEFEFECEADNVWVVRSRDTAEKARLCHPYDYNSEYNYPVNPYESDDLEVVELK